MAASYEERIRQLVRKLRVVDDPGLVEGLARELIAERPAEVLAEWMAALGRLAREEGPRAAYVAVLRLAIGHAGELSEAVRQEVYSRLAARGEAVFVRYLLPLAAARGATADGLPRDPALDDIPLGMKKWKARLHDRDLLKRLARDHNPAVLRILLDNPKVTEDDVVGWAARRPSAVGYLLAIATHRKWTLRTRVQEALARNPYMPAHVAAAFLPLFPTALLRGVEEDTTLHAAVRGAAKELRELRKR